LCATTLVNRAGTMALTFLALYLTRNGWTARDAGLLVSAYGLGGVFASPIAGRLCDRVSPRRVLLGSLFVSGRFLMAYPLAHPPAAILALTIGWSISGEACRPANYAFVGAAAPPEKRSVAYAANRLAVNIGASIGPAVGGLLARVAMPVIFIADGATSVAAGI